MKVLITGSEGFIGKHLFKYLKKKKIIVYPYDLYLSQDILDKKTLEKAIKKVDYIIHLAAVGDVYQAEKDPQNTLKVGIIGTQNLIDVANRYPIKKIIYASTWEVYGKPITNQSMRIILVTQFTLTLLPSLEANLLFDLPLIKFLG